MCGVGAVRICPVSCLVAYVQSREEAFFVNHARRKKSQPRESCENEKKQQTQDFSGVVGTVVDLSRVARTERAQINPYTIYACASEQKQIQEHTRRRPNLPLILSSQTTNRPNLRKKNEKTPGKIYSVYADGQSGAHSHERTTHGHNAALAFNAPVPNNSAPTIRVASCHDTKSYYYSTHLLVL